MDTRQFRPLQEATILNVLYQVRAEIVRNGLPNLDAVDVLIKARGADPEARLIRRAWPRRFRRGHLSRAVLKALRDGPQNTVQIAASVSDAPGTYESVQSALTNLRRKGCVVVVSPSRGRIGQVWGLAP